MKLLQLSAPARHMPSCALLAIRRLIACSLGLSTSALANGVYLNEQSASAAGTAYAGRSSSALDASTLYSNPAGLSKISRTEISGGFALVEANVDINDAHGAANGTNKGDSVPSAAIPFGFFSTPVNDRFTAGIGLYVPAGLTNDYEDSYQGRYFGSYSAAKVITLQPTLALRINDRISIGAGPTFNRIDGKLQNYLATGALNNGTDTRISVSGDDTAIGYNLGILADITDNTTWGLTYHSKVDYHLEGTTKVTDAPAFLGVNGKYDGRLDITLPETIDTSITHHFDDRWTGYLGTVWSRWERLEKIEVNNSGVPSSAVGSRLAQITEPLNWHNTWSFAVGGAYQMSPEVTLRAGFAYDPSPTDNQNRNVRIPTGNRKSIALGMGYSPSADFTVDLAYGYIRESKASVSQSDESALKPSYSASYKNSGQGLVTQFTYRY